MTTIFQALSQHDIVHSRLGKNNFGIHFGRKRMAASHHGNLRNDKNNFVTMDIQILSNLPNTQSSQKEKES